MRAKEFISEDSVEIHGKAFHVNPLPTGQKFPGQASLNYYHMYRFGIAMAQAEENMGQHADLGIVGSDLVVIPYSKEEQSIMDKAAKKMGSPGVDVGLARGKEEGDHNPTSVVAKSYKNKYGV